MLAHTLRFLFFLHLFYHHLLTTALDSSNNFWWLQNSSRTFLDRYHDAISPTSDRRSQTPLSDIPSSALPHSVRNLFDTNTCEIDVVDAPLTTTKFRNSYFLNKPVLVRRRTTPTRTKAEERWSSIEYLNQTAGHLNVMVGTSRRIIESGGDGSWKTPLSEFLSSIDHKQSNQKIPSRPIYAFDRGHLFSESNQLRRDLGGDPSFFKHSATTAKQLSHKKSEKFFRGKEEILQYFLMTAGDGSGVQVRCCCCLSLT